MRRQTRATTSSKQIGVEDPGRLGQRTQRGSRATEDALDLGEFTGLLNPSQACQDGIEEVEQDQGGILIEMELAVAGLIPGARRMVQFLQDRHQQLEVLEAAQILHFDLGSFLPRHTSIVCATNASRANKVWREDVQRGANLTTQLPCRTELGHHT